MGCVGVSESVDDVPSVMQLLLPIMAQLIHAGIDVRMLAHQLMVMPVTSFGQTNVANATHAMNVTCQVADHLRHHFEQQV